MKRTAAWAVPYESNEKSSGSFFIRSCPISCMGELIKISSESSLSEADRQVRCQNSEQDGGKHVGDFKPFSPDEIDAYAEDQDRADER